MVLQGILSGTYCSPLRFTYLQVAILFFHIVPLKLVLCLGRPCLKVWVRVLENESCENPDALWCDVAISNLLSGPKKCLKCTLQPLVLTIIRPKNFELISSYMYRLKLQILETAHPSYGHANSYSSYYNTITLKSQPIELQYIA